jgi:hypothetical protein
MSIIYLIVPISNWYPSQVKSINIEHHSCLQNLQDPSDTAAKKGNVDPQSRDLRFEDYSFRKVDIHQFPNLRNWFCNCRLISAAMASLSTEPRGEAIDDSSVVLESEREVFSTTGISRGCPVGSSMTEAACAGCEILASV